MHPIPNLLDILEPYQARQLSKAEAACCRLLKAEPGNADALLLGGSIALDLGDLQTSQLRLHRLASLPHVGQEMHHQAALLLARGDDLCGAVAVLRQLKARYPAAFPVLYDLAQMEEALNDPEAALHTYEAAIDTNPGHAGPFTRRAALLLRKSFGAPLATPADKAQTVDDRKYGRLVMSTLGSNGRFGNQLLQYILLRALGEVHKLTVEAPEWLGRWLFDLSDPYPGSPLPVLAEDGDNLACLMLEKAGPTALMDRDIWGYGCYHTRFYRPHRELMQRLFSPGEWLRPRTEATVQKIAAKGKTLVALHLRRGDFGQGPFWIAPEAWYLEWLKMVWLHLEHPVLYVASDDPALFRKFAAYSPITATAIGAPLVGAEFYDDFHVLTQANYLAISNSTFSFVAALLNKRAECFVRPDATEKRLVAFDPWNSEVLMPNADSKTWDA